MLMHTKNKDHHAGPKLVWWFVFKEDQIENCMACINRPPCLNFINLGVMQQAWNGDEMPWPMCTGPLVVLSPALPINKRTNAITKVPVLSPDPWESSSSLYPPYQCSQCPLHLDSSYQRKMFAEEKEVGRRRRGSGCHGERTVCLASPLLPNQTGLSHSPPSRCCRLMTCNNHKHW